MEFLGEVTISLEIMLSSLRTPSEIQEMQMIRDISPIFS
jgi:hypothetical protein